MAGARDICSGYGSGPSIGLSQAPAGPLRGAVAPDAWRGTGPASPSGEMLYRDRIVASEPPTGLAHVLRQHARPPARNRARRPRGRPLTSPARAGVRVRARSTSCPRTRRRSGRARPPSRRTCTRRPPSWRPTRRACDPFAHGHREEVSASIPSGSSAARARTSCCRCWPTAYCGPGAEGIYSEHGFLCTGSRSWRRAAPRRRAGARPDDDVECHPRPRHRATRGSST